MSEQEEEKNDFARYTHVRGDKEPEKGGGRGRGDRGKAEKQRNPGGGGGKKKVACIESCVPPLLAGPHVSDTCFNAYRSTGARVQHLGHAHPPKSVSKVLPRSALRRFYGHCGARSRRRPGYRDVFRAGRSKAARADREGLGEEDSGRGQGESVDIGRKGGMEKCKTNRRWVAPSFPLEFAVKSWEFQWRIEGTKGSRG